MLQIRNTLKLLLSSYSTLLDDFAFFLESLEISHCQRDRQSQRDRTILMLTSTYLDGFVHIIAGVTWCVTC